MMNDNVMLVKQLVFYQQYLVYANRVCLFLFFSRFYFNKFFKDILVCINHIDQLCSCSPRKYCLWYRYTLDEMSNMLDALRERLDLCQKWKILVNRLISTDHQTLIGII
jgi:hypothetical protein